jgi:hypothetical protein
MAPHQDTRSDSFNTQAEPPKIKPDRPRNVEWIENVKWDDSLQPKHYDIYGTHPDSKILFLDVSILDSTGRDPYPGHVLIEGKWNDSTLTFSVANSLYQVKSSLMLAKFLDSTSLDVTQK